MNDRTTHAFQTPMPSGPDTLLGEYAQRLASHGAAAAQQQLQQRLLNQPVTAWIDCARALLDGGGTGAAGELLIAAGRRFPGVPAVGYWLAEAFRLTAHFGEAEALLGTLLAQLPDYHDARFLLAATQREQGKLSAATATVMALPEPAAIDPEITLTAIKLLDTCSRTHEAALFCERAIDHGSDDARLYAHAGRYAIQLGQFELARERYLHVLEDPRVLDWHIPQALSTTVRYADASHPDFARFQAFLHNPALSENGRASTEFALGKACDDIGDYAQATTYLRAGNERINRQANWSDARWQENVDAKIARAPLPPIAAPTDWTPVFIVGMPRSGTTLVEERLTRHPQVTGRGELGWMPFLAQQFEQRIEPVDATALQRAAAIYAAQVRQDDAPVRFYIDKQPLNFLHLGLIAAIFPNARVIYCERDPRDTALSIWSQYFAGTEGDFAYDLANIAGLARGCQRVMAHWRATLPLAIHSVDYAQMVQAPEQTLAALQAFLGLPAQDLLGGEARAESSIATSSMWQARQPVYARSLARWQHYAEYLPELVELFPDAGAA